MRVLVTGGAGHVGSTLVDRLLAEDHHVDVVDDLSTGSLANLADAREVARLDGRGRLKFHQLDVADPNLVTLAERCGPDVVVHLATPTAKSARRDEARRAADVVRGSLRVLEAAEAAGAGHVVRVANARAQADPVRRVPDLAVQEYLAAAEERGLGSTTLVASTVYGPRQADDTESCAVAVLVSRVLAADACVLHGEGRSLRDLVHVDDVVDAVVRALDRRGATSDAAIVEVGSGETTSIVELHGRIVDVSGLEVPEPVFGAARAGEPGEVRADPRGAHDLLGWRPFTDLDVGLAATIEARRLPATD